MVASTLTPMPSLDKLTLKELRVEKEELYWGVLLFFTLSMSLLLILLFPLVLIGAGLLVCVMQLFLAYVRGNGVKVTPAQFGELHARIDAASKRLGLARAPDAYIVQAGGVLNAMATKLLGRNFIIIYSDLVEACGADDKALDFVVGHELGHIALGHLKWMTWLLPARFVPLFWQAYSRACEYSCDRCGLVVAGDLESASRGLAILAAGPTMARRMSMEAFSAQAVEETSGFWAHVFELNASHPFLTKRVRALRNFMNPASDLPVRRRIFPILFAPVLGQPVAMGVGVFYVGILAAVAIPSFIKYQTKAKQAEARAVLMQCHSAQQSYFSEHKRYATTFADLGLLAANAPSTYTLYMGENQLGPDKPVPDGLRGFVSAEEGYVCVAVNNMDEDETWDTWVIEPALAEAHHYIDDETDQVFDWREEE